MTQIIYINIYIHKISILMILCQKMTFELHKKCVLCADWLTCLMIYCQTGLPFDLPWHMCILIVYKNKWCHLTIGQQQFLLNHWGETTIGTQIFFLGWLLLWFTWAADLRPLLPQFACRCVYFPLSCLHYLQHFLVSILVAVCADPPPPPPLPPAVTVAGLTPLRVPPLPPPDLHALIQTAHWLKQRGLPSLGWGGPWDANKRTSWCTLSHIGYIQNWHLKYIITVN